MAKQTAVDSLRESIRLLEIRQAEERKALEDQLRLSYESLKPINLIKSSMKEFTNSVELRNGLFETIISILSGYVTQKLVLNSKSSTFMKIIGAVLQFGVTSVVAKNSDTIRNFINDMIDKYLHPKAEEVTEPEVKTE